jgi:hypothetical protein
LPHPPRREEIIRRRPGHPNRNEATTMSAIATCPSPAATGAPTPALKELGIQIPLGPVGRLRHAGLGACRASPAGPAPTRTWETGRWPAPRAVEELYIAAPAG